jgi:hypothetical protein
VRQVVPPKKNATWFISAAAARTGEGAAFIWHDVIQ